MAYPKVSVTKNYRLFLRSDKNRPLDVKKHRELYDSMKRYGYLWCYPIVVFRNGSKQLTIKEGQHRLAIAEELGEPVYYIETPVDFDVAVINCTSKPWVLKDYAQKHAANGIEVYRKGLDFAESHGLPIGIAFALLAGTTSFTNVRSQFVDGEFEIKDQEWADRVASMYCAIVALSERVRGARFLQACIGACRVKGFKPERLIRGAKRCREKLASYSTKDAYLDMLEDIYNYGQSSLVGLKAKAQMVMRARNAVKPK
jgi:hypothetical protein